MDLHNHKPADIMHVDGKTRRLYDMPCDGPDGKHRNIRGMTAIMIYRVWQRGRIPDYR